MVVGGNAVTENVSDASNPRIGAIATNYADIVIVGNASGGRYGVYAGGSSTAEVGGNASGGMYGAYAELNSSVEVAGNVEATENYGTGACNYSDDSVIIVGGNSITNTSTGIGAVAIAGSITIDGTITAAADTYIRVGTTDRSAEEYTTEAEKPGYRKYSDGVGTVWVKETESTTNVCEIVGGLQYATLGEALAAVTDSTPRTIKLLEDITHTDPIYLNGKQITFDLDGKNLVIDTSSVSDSTALAVVNGGSVDYTGNGEFNVIGEECGVNARDGGSSATVTNVQATGYDGDGVRASFGGCVIVKGNVVYSGNSDDHDDSGYGISLISDGSIEVDGGVTAIGSGSQGILATGGTVLVAGNVTAAKRGVYSYNTADVTVDGNLTVTDDNSVGIDAGGSSTVQIGGNVTASGASSTAVYANNSGSGSGGTVTISGTVQSDYLGVHATGGGKVTIDGELVTSPIAYIKIGETEKDADDHEITSSLPGYLEYTDSTSFIWVKETADVTFPNVTTNPVNNITSVGAAFSGNVISSGGATVTERGFVYGVDADPAIGSSTQITSGSGTGRFSETVTGLSPNTTYHVRAYAINSVGTAYGSDVSFTTLPLVTAPTAPQSFTAVPGNGQVALSWTAPASNGGAAIIRYEVSSNNGITWVTADSNSSHTFTGLSNGISYTFKVRAVNSEGNGAESSITATPATGNGGEGRDKNPTAASPTIPAANGAVKVAYSQTGSAVTLTLTTSKINETIKNSTDTAVLDLSDVKDITATILPKSALTAIADAELGVEVRLPQGTVVLDSTVASSVASQADGNNVSVELKQVDASSLSSVQRSAIKDEDVVIDINILSGTQKISTFDGKLTVTVPYTGQQPVTVWYLNDAGEMEKLQCTYDAATNTVSFTLDHLSLYVIGKEETQSNLPWVNSFTDVKESDWFYQAVEYAVVNRLFSDVYGTLFNPNMIMTRGMMVTVLWRLDGSPLTGSSVFADVAAGSDYAKAVAWAASKGIVRGVGGNIFAPDENVTREQMAVMMYNYVKAMNIDLPKKRTGVFADENKISPWAKEAADAMFGAEVLNGKGGNMFDPQGNATRAEVAYMLKNFMEAIK